MASPSIAPIFLRAALAVTFLWAGFGKLLDTMAVTGAKAALLANMGVIAPLSPDAKKSSSLGQPGGVPVLSTLLAMQPASSGTPVVKEPQEPAKPAAEVPATKSYGASDFPDERRVARMYGIALLIHAAANPASDERGNAKWAMLPASLGQGSTPRWLAIAAVATEIVAGLFVLVGLLTRVSALALAGTMMTAIWLTEMGPAIQNGQTILGFIPSYPAYGVDAAGKFLYATLLWQCSLLCIAMALTFTGPGAVSFDRALFPPKGSRKADADEE
jgi:uncharacterized membrane protein YphA (DoxX/SURF4 family)